MRARKENLRRARTPALAFYAVVNARDRKDDIVYRRNIHFGKNLPRQSPRHCFNLFLSPCCYYLTYCITLYPHFSTKLAIDAFEMSFLLFSYKTRVVLLTNGIAVFSSCCNIFVMRRNARK